MSEKEGEMANIREPELLAPATPGKTIAALKRFQEFKEQVLDKEDYVDIKGKRTVKKSGWLKYALACSLSLEMRTEREDRRQDGEILYHYTYRAIAPNGRFADAVGSASSKEREFVREIHDIRALAQTRAVERAISNLVGGGELGAEELEGGTEPPGKSVPPRAPDQQIPQHVTANLGLSMKVPVVKDTVNIEGIRQFPILKDGTALGMVNVLEDGTEASIVPETPVPVDDPAIKNFLIAKFLESNAEKPDFKYSLDIQDGLLFTVLIKGKLDEAKVKGIINAARWAFDKATTRGAEEARQ